MARTRLTLDDLMRVKTLRNLQVSPDGTRVAFVVEQFRAKQDDRAATLWLAWLDGREDPVMLTRSGTGEGHPRWSPDSRRLAFLSRRPAEWLWEAEHGSPKPAGTDTSRVDDEEPKPQIWCLDLSAGGEAQQLTHRAEGVEDFDWSPDGTALVFQARDPSPQQAAYLKGLTDKKQDHPLVIRRVQHKADGAGYLDDVPSHLFILSLAGLAERPLTHGSLSETSPRWSPDGQWIVFSSNRTGNADNNRRNDLWLVRPEDGTCRRLTHGDVAMDEPAWSPDSRSLAAVGSFVPESGYVLQHLWLLQVSDARPIDGDLADQVGVGWERIGGVVPDEPGSDPVAAARVYPVPLGRTEALKLTEGILGPIESRPCWSVDGTRLRALVGHQGQARLLEVRVPRDEPPTWSLIGDEDALLNLDGYHEAGAAAAVIANRPQSGAEVTALEDDGRLGRPLTAFHAWTQDRTLGTYRRIRFANPDGKIVQGWAVLPPGDAERPDGPAPVLVNIHGGPMAYDAPRFQFDEHYWASLGYLVLMVDYRGSISYGEAWCQSIQGDWGPREHADVMAGVDYVVAEGLGDPARLFCTGFSQGGIMTNWAIGHTDRFRAAVSEHGMWDYLSAFGTDDCHLWWQDDVGVPWQNPDQYLRISPMSGLANIRTPLLITAGEHDWRCPLNQAEELYVALKKRGVPTELVIYRGEHHAISKPSRARDRLLRGVRWLEGYGGQAVDAGSEEAAST